MTVIRNIRRVEAGNMQISQDRVNSTRLVKIKWAEIILCATKVGDTQ